MNRTTLLPALVTWLCIAIPLPAQQDGEPVLYELGPETVFAEGCFELCRCPIFFSEDIEGTFVLTPAGEDGDFRLFEVSDVDWSVTTGSERIQVTGQGTYRIGGETGRRQQLDLELVVGDRPVQQFLSGPVEARVEFPAIEVTISMHLEPACMDTEFRTVAAPASGQQREFVRGDCNGDGEVTGSITDALFGLRFLFIGDVARPPCLAACDANGDGDFSSVTDAIYTLNFNFRGGPPPPEPYPGCGVGTEPGDVNLGCETATACP